MAQIKIKDSGYVKPDNSGTQLSTALRANDGDSIDLDSVTVAVSSQANQDATPTLNSFEASEINVSNFENDVIVITGIIDPDTDADFLYELSRLPKTVGYKWVYYDWSVESGATDEQKKTSGKATKQLVYLMANGHVVNPPTTNMEHIHVRFDSFNGSQRGGQKQLDFTLTGTIMKV